MSNDTPLPSGSTPQTPSDGGNSDIYALNADEVDTETLARDIAGLTWDLKALNTKAIDLRGLVSYTDFVIVCTATSDRHVQAIAKHVQNSLSEAGYKPLGIEGVESGQWALIDFGDAILHIFNGSVRDEYDLERMWPDAPFLELEDGPDDLYGHFELQKL
ncbi:ribosome silencing factor [Persicimonas caeni]|uniref:Ribosomal silencing factor RsfS n=1 Tax=Persicimonas caeni TaxID=2292766 RepID=A0A4Y6Q218_PERCE|nr:ribosome silencing factor [Persicimonas caeni]QDG54227.1 ribosome silencing factor [Persicimonas caeni]QED35448.1 ribosome silencing factor [Persicimonas caeni]